ncbi:TauD/TfdA family dioxygenase [Pollutimonas harenae]|uniref:TauD/TfdA family dioxygenase n=1 Tax=Pollutimonas harenae TaxID=657015 RepID=A0A853H1T9_9BURK|nr:TauD/TfdA family dioxygenase [Pollutimonas harenae]NYT85205.1 TauD/TfdA family dioxygenase [Pollutimonas harenae]TEA72421.1 TauD/TfdA family dioxygenase [Pollutimonas harenae]
MSTANDDQLKEAPVAVEGAAAWYGRDLSNSTAWIHELQPEDIQEIDHAIASFHAQDLSMADISPATFSLPMLSKKLGQILNEILDGRGFVLLRGLPVERYGKGDSAIAYLGIGAHLGSFRSQNAKGHLLGHVRDMGADINQAKTRYYQTNRGLEYHTDSCDIVGLLCLQTSQSGGESRIVSSVTIYNEMMARRPDLAVQLFHAFPTDRRGEIPEGMLPWFEVPVFNWHAGHLTTIYSGQYIRSAQKNFPQARRLTQTEIEALEMLDDLTNDPDLNLQMEFRVGDMQFLHNHQILHSRTDFEDWPEPERRRHLLRLWLSPKTARSLPESFAARYGSLEPGNRGGIVVKDTRLNFTLEDF